MIIISNDIFYIDLKFVRSHSHENKYFFLKIFNLLRSECEGEGSGVMPPTPSSVERQVSRKQQPPPPSSSSSPVFSSVLTNQNYNDLSSKNK